MVKVQDFYRFLDGFAPFSSALSFDNSGLLVGPPEKEVKTVLLSLDIPSYVALEAAERGADLVISHHPVIFHPLRCLTPEKSVYYLIKNEIAAICAHTNLDAADGGVNDVLCEKVGLSKISYFSPEGEPKIGRIGFSSGELSAETFALSVKKKLGSNRVDFVDVGRKVRKIAVVSGSGGDYLAEALKQGCDTLLTGEAKYHHFPEAVERGVNLIAAGHYATENPIVGALKKVLEIHFPEITFLLSESNLSLPFSV